MALVDRNRRPGVGAEQFFREGLELSQKLDEKNHIGNFSKNITQNNTVNTLLNLLDEKWPNNQISNSNVKQNKSYPKLIVFSYSIEQEERVLILSTYK